MAFDVKVQDGRLVGFISRYKNFFGGKLGWIEKSYGKIEVAYVKDGWALDRTF